ncbi:MAG: class II fructose-bisphosphate aldolase [Dongiaceae bacterium]
MRRAFFVVHSLSQAKAAVAAAAERKLAVTLLSAPGAAAFAGAGWFAALIRRARESQPQAEIAGILDCGPRADLVQAAFREKLAQVVFTGDARQVRPLRDIARQWQAEILRRRPRACDLRHAVDPAAVCNAWLDKATDLKKRRPRAIQGPAARSKKRSGR